MKILALDSSGNVASVAIVTEQEVVAEYTTNFKKTHSQTLLPMLDEVVKNLGIDLAEMDAVAVASGPGSFTGLRIGSSTAKGLAQVLEKEIVSVPTLEGLAYNLYGADSLVCPIMDARRNQVYAGVYRFVPDEESSWGMTLEVVREQDALAIEDLCDFLNERKEAVIFLGDGVLVFSDYIKEHLSVSYRLAPPPHARQRAAAVAQRAMEYVRQNKTEHPKDHKPEYLRVSQAEREKKENPKNPDWNKMSSIRMAKDDISYRTMEIADLPQVLEIELANFSEPWTDELFRKAMEKPENLYTVAEKEREILGFCGIWGVSGEGQICNVAVKEGVRGKGIGYELLSRSMKEMKKMGNEEFTLEVRVSNLPAIRLYEKLGFMQEGVRKNFYRKPEEDASIMWIRKQ